MYQIWKWDVLSRPILAGCTERLYLCPQSFQALTVKPPRYLVWFQGWSCSEQGLETAWGPYQPELSHRLRNPSNTIAVAFNIIENIHKQTHRHLWHLLCAAKLAMLNRSYCTTQKYTELLDSFNSVWYI